jgi:hypothetical protein
MYWDDSPLQERLPGMPRTSHDADWTKLLLLWDLLDSQDIKSGFTLRIVHTLAPGTYGSAVPIDLSIPLDASGGSWESLEFSGGDDAENFFVVDIDEPGAGGTKEAK